MNLVVIMQNKANFRTEVRKQKTEDSKIRAKSTPKLRFSVPTNFFYKCRGSSTNRPYFLQNKANFKKARINVNYYLQKDYENKLRRRLWENKPNQTQCRNSSKLVIPIKNSTGAVKS